MFVIRCQARPILAGAMLALCTTATAFAQDVPAPSPKARVEQRVGLTDFALDYSSPAVKKRKIWGELVPYDKVWRAGANAPTKLTVSRDFEMGGTKVKAGAYALIITPGKASWTVHLNSNVEGGATQNYDPKNDVAKVTVKPSAMPAARERLTFLFSDTTDDATVLEMEWDKTRVRVPFKVDTKAHVDASMEKALGDAWRPHMNAARYLLDTGGDLDRATSLIDKSISIQATWWNEWVRAQIMGKKGNKAEALASATRAQSLGQGDRVYEGFFKADIAKAIAGWK